MPNEELIREGSETAPPTVRELAMILFRQRRVFLCVAGLILGAAIAYAWLGSRFEAHMQVLVRRGRSDPPATAQENAPVDLSRVVVTEEELNSEVELLKDDEVLRRVVEANHLETHDWLHWLRPGEDQAARIERAARRLAKRLRVEPVKKTNLIAVTYDAPEPHAAAKVLQSLATVYVEKHMEVHRPGGEFHFFDQQTAESGRQLEQAQRLLLDFTVNHGVVEAAQQRDLALQRSNDVEAAYRDTQVAIAETEHRVKELEAQLAKLPPRTTTQVRIADNAELMRALKASLLDLELKKTQLLTKFEPTHRLVQEVEQQILQAKADVAAEMTNPLRDETTEKDTNYEWAKAELQKARVELKGLEAKATTTSAQLAGYRAMARQLGEDAITQDALLSSEKAAEDNYLLYVKKREEARMGDALDRGGIVNVAVAEEPVVPALPVWPAWGIVLGGFLAAGASGAGAAFARDYLDPAFRTPEEVLACLDVPVLASLPRNGRRLCS
jgi:polysaccharide biosynthesis protein PslE